MSNLTFIHDAEKHQFRLMMGDGFALIGWYWVHAEVPHDLRGQCILVRFWSKKRLSIFKLIKLMQLPYAAISSWCSTQSKVAQRDRLNLKLLKAIVFCTETKCSIDSINY
jgi:hypothetical protein